MGTDWTKAAAAWGGAPSAGSPGMGGGPVPYAPGATTYTPQTTPGPQGATPQGGTGLPQMNPNAGSYQGYDPSQSAPGGQQSPQPPAQMGQDQYMANTIAYARAIMERLKAEIRRGQEGKMLGRRRF